MGENMIDVLIADDHRLVREGLKKILSEVHDIVVADEASTGNEALRKVRKRDFDVIVLDISMPEKNGIEVLEHLKKEKPESRVLILSMHPEEQYALRALKAGAAGYLTKESAPNELIDAIRRVATGKKYITSTIAENLATALNTNTPNTPHELLSNREFQVLRMMAQGGTLTEIAEELNLSIKTVSTYRSRILEKMGMKNNSELIFYAFKNGLVP
jgi:two-component system, NarL family, invasion response regulator UvrY